MKFQKMHGLGNDFILMDEIDPLKYDLAALAIKLCDRHQGVGADGIILILPSEIADVKMRIINSDGSEANMCGNGIRCFAKYVYDNQINTSKSFTIETGAGIMIPELIVEDGKVLFVKVNMGAPHLERSQIPMTGAPGNVINETINIAGNDYKITSLLMGVPHTIVFADHLAEEDLITLGKLIEKHPSFTQGTNVNFVEVLNDHEVNVRTWERGAGRTLACGTGSCASAVAASLNDLTGKEVTVHLALGDLLIEWKDGLVYMTGSANHVFEGEIEI
ncbi:MAG: diaminopimelate epimerase [Mariniphaga sp.]|nr:diaminopimelate epimerase [Mariniphaga sp.]